MGRGAWRATVYMVTKQLKRLSMHAQVCSSEVTHGTHVFLF